jgi:hypothetical protein
MDRHYGCSSYFPGGQGRTLHSGWHFGVLGPPKRTSEVYARFVSSGVRLFD